LPGAAFDDLLYATAPVAYGVAFFHHGVHPQHALLAYGYSRLAGIVSAGLRLISIGQTEGQQLLTRALSRLPRAVDKILERQQEPLRAFSPLMDIQQMNHRDVYSRLFRS
jgi:urease accessory protein